MFHSEIGARSVLRVVDEVLHTDECGEQDGGYSAKFQTEYMFIRSGREQNSTMYHTRGNAQWSSDQLHVRLERWL